MQMAMDTQRPVTAHLEQFAGLSPRHAKRRALGYWYAHRGELGLTASEFFARCRLGDEGGLARITFYGAGRRP